MIQHNVHQATTQIMEQWSIYSKTSRKASDLHMWRDNHLLTSHDGHETVKKELPALKSSPEEINWLTHHTVCQLCKNQKLSFSSSQESRFTCVLYPVTLCCIITGYYYTIWHWNLWKHYFSSQNIFLHCTSSEMIGIYLKNSWMTLIVLHVPCTVKLQRYPRWMTCD